jgi:hypothetical protein
MTAIVTSAAIARPRPFTGELLRAALEAAERGWPVFPLVPRGKKPAIDGWQQRATCDPGRIRRWWTRYPRCNVGINCGPAGLLVLDLDAAHGRVPEQWARHGVTHGRDVLGLLAQLAGEPDPVDTFTVATPRVINGSLRVSLLCIQRLTVMSPRLVDSVLSAGVLQRDTTTAIDSARRKS